ncbi:MAG: Fe-S cluster assembly ATPase SufC [Acidimicrobiia bacterium]|nr:Fe-S cluster assembly ATPase SufC [Acidimicrobiia bacterium]
MSSPNASAPTNADGHPRTSKPETTDQVPSAPNDSAPLLSIEELQAKVGETQILHGVSLTIDNGSVHAVMGPNGSGKSTLARTLMADPRVTVTGGTVRLRGQDVAELSATERAAAGIFLGFQYPEEIPGVTMLNFLRRAMSARKDFEMSVLEVRLALMDWMDKLKMDSKFADRYLNEGFSGGEKKRNEILQMALLEPDVAILDETDSGLDIDALRIVSEGIQTVRTTRPDMGVLIITHYQRILDYLTPDFVHVLIDGRIAASGGPDLARRLETEGYEAFQAQPAN